MDLTRAVSPPSAFSQRFNGPHRSTSKPVEMRPSRNRGPMTIPNSRGEPPPPPLPPPMYMDDIAAGSDPGWAWENRRSAGVGAEGRGLLGSDSSMPQGWKIKQERDEGPERPDYARRGSSQATIKPAPELPTKYDFSRHHDEGYYSLSGPSLANYQSVSVSFSHRVCAGPHGTTGSAGGCGPGERRVPPNLVRASVGPRGHRFRCQSGS